MQVHAVIVLLAERPQLHGSLQPAQCIPQRKLIQAVAFKFLHPLARLHALHAQGRFLCQLAPLADRKRIGRAQPGPRSQPQPHKAQQRQREALL